MSSLSDRRRSLERASAGEADFMMTLAWSLGGLALALAGERAIHTGWLIFTCWMPD